MPKPFYFNPSCIYIGDKPVAFSEETKLAVVDDDGIELNSQEGSNGWKSSVPPMEFTVKAEQWDVLRDMMYNFIIPYWSANHRGNCTVYSTLWETVSKYINNAI